MQVTKLPFQPIVNSMGLGHTMLAGDLTQIMAEGFVCVRGGGGQSIKTKLGYP